MKLKCALILDDLKILKWQIEALDMVKDLIDLGVILNCKNTKIKRNVSKHFFYYILNIFCLSNNQTTKSIYKVSEEKVIDFYSKFDGEWQIIPKTTLEDLRSDKIDVIIKFGMNLLKIDKSVSGPPILSFHHGDPSKFRGRPAGFYEILKNDSTVGVTLQALSNKIDGGKVYGFGQTKLINYSYKKTAVSYYLISKYILRQGLINFKQRETVETETSGINYRLPSNFTVARFILIVYFNLIKKIVYGVFFEKRWRIALGKSNINFESTTSLSINDLEEIPTLDKYTFYADPFFSIDNKLIRCEALEKKSGIGSIIEIPLSNMKTSNVLCSGKHYSFPVSFIFNKKEHVLPEVASHSSPYFFCLEGKSIKKENLEGLNNMRVVDGVLHRKGEYWYFFFGEKENSQSVLQLWISKSFNKKFRPHPMSPIAINPRLARMGGKLISKCGNLYRFGQNNCDEYGKSITIMKIMKLTPKKYKEIYCGEINIKEMQGPHTISIDYLNNSFVLDYNERKFSIFSGLRRAKAIFYKV